MPKAALKFWEEGVNPGDLIFRAHPSAWEGLQENLERDDYEHHLDYAGGFLHVDVG